MAMNNRDRIHKAMDLLGPALNRFITVAVAPEIGDTAWVDMIRLRDNSKGAPPDKKYNPDDPQTGLRMLTENIPNAAKKGWYPFNGRLSRVQLSWAVELREARNSLAHGEAFVNEDAQRALDTAERFLDAIGAPDEAKEVRTLRNDVVRIAHDREDASAARSNPNLAVGSDNLPPWREVLSPHPDVASGNFNAAEFAADLYSVANPTSDTKKNTEYSDPASFFERTYLTHGLRDLINRNVRRLTGDMNASPVVNLQTNFGGGKTHSMLALWHLASGTSSDHYPDDVAALAKPLDQLTNGVRRVALVGNQLVPARADTRDGRPGIRTVWGELAWQLGGKEAFDLVADSDRTSTSPGAELRDLLALYSPAVILIDEWVAYARQLINADNLPAGDFDTQFTFAQTLTEAANATAGVQVVISIPASSNPADGQDAISDEEVGGEHGREALARLRQIVGRTADQWQPANAQESFEIVRRRIFATPDGTTMTTISAIAKAVVEFYRSHATEFPNEVRENAYIDRIKQCYPIHPELFDRLYEDWSTLDRFQRTRGVLRVMNQIVGTLWQEQDKAPLILPGGIPLESADFVTEISHYLDDPWRPIIDTDVAGKRAIPRQVDKDHDLFGKRGIAERLARAIFMAATPALHTAHKGVDKPRIFLGTAIPGDVPGNFHSALDHLTNRSTYLYTEASRFWYDTHANTTRTARDHAANLPDADVWTEVEDRLNRARKHTRDNTFGGIHVFPTSSAEVSDEQLTRLVIVPMKYTHSARGASTARTWAADVVEHRGAINRTYKNSLVFLTADDKRAPELGSAVRDFIAWRYVSENAEDLNLSSQQTKQAKNRMARADEIVNVRLLETFVWAVYPKQQAGQATYEMTMSSTAGTTDDLIARTATKLDDAIARSRSAALIRMDLDNTLAPAWESGHVTVGQLYTYYATYPYLTRLRDRDSLIDGLLSVYNDTAWSTNGFAFADAYDESTGHYVGLVLPGASENPYLVDSALIVKPDVALAEQQWLADELATTGQPRAATRAADDGPPEPTLTPQTRYFGSVELNPDLPVRDFSTIQREVLQHLSASGVSVEVRVAIRATAPNGFDRSRQRVIRENADTLGFTENIFDTD
ncbi:DUF499 domain-containing protein [Gordonia effusa]